MVRTILGRAHWFPGQEEEALAEFDRALELDPTFLLTLMHASWLHWTRGDTTRFFASRERLDAVSERGEVPASALRQAYAAGGPDSVLRLQAMHRERVATPWTGRGGTSSTYAGGWVDTTTLL